MIREIMPSLTPEVNTPVFPSWLAGGSGVWSSISITFFKCLYIANFQFSKKKNMIRENGLFSCVAVILTNSFASNSGRRNFEFLM